MNNDLQKRTEMLARVPGLDGPSHTADYFFKDGKCVICATAAGGNLGKAAHLRKHVREGILVSRSASHRGGAAHYGRNNSNE